MKTYFSKRHREALSKKTIRPSFPRRVRVSIVRIMECHSDNGGWNNEENFTFEAAEEALKTFYGIDELTAFESESSKARPPSDFAGLIKRGYPTEVIDAIEAWFDQEPKESGRCERELNDCLTMNLSPWRFVNGLALLVNSDYMHEEVRARTLRLLRQGRAMGALEEYQQATQSLQAGEAKDAVVNAHKSVESVMKTALGTDEHLRFGQLLSRLVTSELMPDYYRDFVAHFEKLALGAVKERNQPGAGHGQGQTPRALPLSLAEFAVNLAGSINLFVIQRWIETQKLAEEEPEANAASFEQDIPF